MEHNSEEQEPFVVCNNCSRLKLSAICGALELEGFIFEAKGWSMLQIL